MGTFLAWLKEREKKWGGSSPPMGSTGTNSLTLALSQREREWVRVKAG